MTLLDIALRESHNISDRNSLRCGAFRFHSDVHYMGANEGSWRWLDII